MAMSASYARHTTRVQLQPKSTEIRASNAVLHARYSRIFEIVKAGLAGLHDRLILLQHSI